MIVDERQPTDPLFILQTSLSPTRPSATPPLAGPSGRRPPGLWRSPSRPPAVVVATWLEGHIRDMAPVVAHTSQARPPGRRPLWPTQTHLHPMVLQ